MDQHCELSIVIPCLNESETLATCTRKALRFLNSNSVSGEIIIADNGSTDGSSAIALKEGARVVDIPVKGYGAALLGGIEAARGAYIIMGDADDSYDFTELMPFLEKLRRGFDLVMGNRFKGGIKPGAMPFLHRYLGNPVLSFIGRLFFKSPVGDFHCGLRGFRRDSILSLNLRTTGMEFASEMIVKASLQKLRIAEVPTILYPDGRSRPPHLRTWRDGWRHLRFLLLYSPRWLFLYPGILFVALGLFFSTILLITPIRIGHVVLDIGTLLYTTLFIIIGMQSVIFAVFTKVFGISEGYLPEDQKMTVLLNYVTLETGLLSGGLLITAGVITSIMALKYWQYYLFGALVPSISLRFIIPGVTLFTLGFQIVLASFFLSILGLQRR